MSKQLDHIDADLAGWMAQQRIFFVGTAPLAAGGHVNISPKGGESLRILGPLEAVYQDYTGSGAETAAHVLENGRIVIMFCAFEGGPKIVRLHGRGTLFPPSHPRFSEFGALFPANAGTRAFIHVAVNRVSSSCGYAVPFFEFVGPRDTLDRWAASRTAVELTDYRLAKNQHSIDGLPAFLKLPDSAGNDPV